MWQFSDKIDNFDFLGQNLPKKSGFGITTSQIPYKPVFSQNGHLRIFRSKFGEIAQLRAIFWCESCWGCCRELGESWNELGGGGWSWVEIEMSWMEMDETGWSWVEMDAAGWRWVHGLVISTFKTPWCKLPNLLGMKLTTDVILLFLSSVNNDILVYFWSCRFVLWN